MIYFHAYSPPPYFRTKLSISVSDIYPLIVLRDVGQEKLEALVNEAGRGGSSGDADVTKKIGKMAADVLQKAKKWLQDKGERVLSKSERIKLIFV